MALGLVVGLAGRVLLQLLLSVIGGTIVFFATLFFASGLELMKHTLGTILSIAVAYIFAFGIGRVLYKTHQAQLGMLGTYAGLTCGLILYEIVLVSTGV